LRLDRTSKVVPVIEERVDQLPSLRIAS